MAEILSWIERDFHYEPFWKIAFQMQQWSQDRQHDPQLWYGEHPVVVTKGLRSHEDRVLYWPSVATNRGGLLTVHSPGQLVFYPLWDLRLYNTLSEYRWVLEETVIQTLIESGMPGDCIYRIPESPGVFTSKGKISAMGLRLQRHGVYHGISINVACPLLPFQTIVCCGDPNQTTTSLKEWGLTPSMAQIKVLMKKYFYTLIGAEARYVLHHTSK
jgi:lipoyl(octanoyl) transferase